MVLSDTCAIRGYFDQGAIYATANAQSIAGSVRKGIDAKQILVEQVLELREKLNVGWDVEFGELCVQIKQLNETPRTCSGPG